MVHKSFSSIPPETTVFGLMRHGITVWNEEKRIQGRQDSPLSPAGEKAVNQLSTELSSFSWTRILASDLGRVRQTVDIINQHLNIPVFFDQRLREIDWGRWEGLLLKDVQKKEAEEFSRQVESGWHFRAPGGESRLEVLHRARSAIFDAADKWPGEKILTVCHQGVIKCLIFEIMRKSFLPEKKKILDKAALQLISWHNGKLLPLRLNLSTGHLK